MPHSDAAVVHVSEGHGMQLCRCLGARTCGPVCVCLASKLVSRFSSCGTVDKRSLGLQETEARNVLAWLCSCLLTYDAFFIRLSLLASVVSSGWFVAVRLAYASSALRSETVSYFYVLRGLDIYACCRFIFNSFVSDATSEVRPVFQSRCCGLSSVFE